MAPMKTHLISGFFLFTLVTIAFQAFSQCDIKNRIFPDGTMLYYMDPVNFYWTKAKSLQGNIVTDKENYFVELLPIPFPAKDDGIKFKDDLVMKLANNKEYNLSFYDARYMENDTALQLMYLIDKKEIEDFQNNEVIDVKIDMQGTEGVRTYVFKLHKAALKEQLDCFLLKNEDKEKPKK